MPLPTGTRLGPYEIVALLGAGGMGEVYRARDARLGRDVAIKVLPHHLSASPEGRARFEREARAVSSLNHPNICTLFDIGREGDTDFLVMELVEGETLSQRIARGPLPPADMLKLGAQIADALERAHRAGVVHRDVKPGNVMLGRAGVKLMDFGLARARGVTRPGSGSDETVLAMTQSPTLVAPLTAEGAIVGTFQYMAPEQLEGKEADARADLWALGCVLYEMATGRRAFEGTSQASLISAIMKDEPRPLAELAPLSPAGLDRLVRACLVKDPDERWQDAHDLAVALRWLEAERAAEPGAHAGAPAADPRFHQLTFRRGSITNARFAPDGRTVLYDAAWEDGPRRIYLTRTESPETTELALPPAALLDVSASGELALSLDRRYLGSWWLGTGMLAQAPLFGGSPRELLGGVYEAAWCPDGRTMAVIRRVGLEIVLEFPLGNPVYASSTWLLGARVSPDGRHVAYFDHAGGMGGRCLCIVDRAGVRRSLIEVDFWHGGIAWRPDGRELLFVESRDSEGATVNAVDLDGHRRRLLRIMGGYAALHDVSASGDVLLSRVPTTYSIGFTSPGRERDLELGCFDFSLGKDLSADGRTLLFDEQGVAHGGEMQTSVRGTDGSAPVRLGPGYARDLSPDGRWALNVHEGRIKLLPRGAGAARTLELGPVLPHQFASWHPDGQRVVFLGAEPGAAVRLFIVAAVGGTPRPVTPEGVGFPAGTIAKPVSGDGRRLFALTRENELRIYELESGAERGSFPLEEDEEPIRWSGDDRTIFIWRRGDVPARVQRLDVASGERTAWREYPPIDPTGVVSSRTVLLTPDGETCAYTYASLMSELFVVRGLS